VRVKLIQVESLEMPVKAMFKATETPNVANDSESKAEHDTVKSCERSQHPQIPAFLSAVSVVEEVRIYAK
jgi:hypothetical protein